MELFRIWSYSPSRLKALLRSLNLPYSPQQIDELKDELYRKARELRSRELPEEVFALFIDPESVRKMQ